MNISSTILEIPYKHAKISSNNSLYENNEDTRILKLILPKTFIPLQKGNYFLKYADPIDQGKSINGECYIENEQFVIQITGHDRKYNEFPEFDLYYIYKMIKLVNHDDLVLITNIKMNGFDKRIIVDGTPILLSDSVFYLVEKGNHEIIIEDNSSYSRTYNINFNNRYNGLIIFSKRNVLTSTNIIGTSVITSEGTALLQSTYCGSMCCVLSQMSVNPIIIYISSLLIEFYFEFGRYNKGIKEFISHNEKTVLENNEIVPKTVLRKEHFVEWEIH